MIVTVIEKEGQRRVRHWSGVGSLETLIDTDHEPPVVSVALTADGERDHAAEYDLAKWFLSVDDSDTGETFASVLDLGAERARVRRTRKRQRRQHSAAVDAATGGNPPHVNGGGPMVEGQHYRIKMRYQSGNMRWVERVMVAAYIDIDKNLSEYVFSLRPLAGTTSVPFGHVVSIESTTAAIHQQRKES